MVAAHDAYPDGGSNAAGSEGVRHGVGAPVHLGIAEAAEFVDQPRAIAISDGGDGEQGPDRTVAIEGLVDSQQAMRALGPDRPRVDNGRQGLGLEAQSPQESGQLDDAGQRQPWAPPSQEAWGGYSAPGEYGLLISGDPLSNALDPGPAELQQNRSGRSMNDVAPHENLDDGTI